MRSALEIKPTWRSLPPTLQRRVQEIFGSPIARATRIWGGYAPTPSFRLVLIDGRRVFFKGTNQASNDISRSGLVREERIYRDIAHWISPWAPFLYDAFHHEDWHVLLLEDVGPKSVPPWTTAKAQNISYALAAFHQTTRGKELPLWLPRLKDYLSTVVWSRVVADSENFWMIASLAEKERYEAFSWLQAASPLLSRVIEGVAELPGPYTLMHNDLRSDNLRLTQGGLRLFDWSFAAVGLTEWDIVKFALSITIEGGVEPERVISWYSERFPTKDEVIDASIVWWMVFFADRAWRPDVRGLPRLRHFQCQQLAVLVNWIARRFCLPEPKWAAAISR